MKSYLYLRVCLVAAMMNVVATGCGDAKVELTEIAPDVWQFSNGGEQGWIGFDRDGIDNFKHIYPSPEDEWYCDDVLVSGDYLFGKTVVYGPLSTNPPARQMYFALDTARFTDARDVDGVFEFETIEALVDYCESINVTVPHGVYSL